jgi:hypothetical protein
MPHPFNVLDHFHVTDCWYEMNNGLHCFKFRLEKIDLATKSWWAPVDSVFVEPDYSIQPATMICLRCGQESTQVYAELMCLNIECAQFWKSVDGTLMSENIEFNPIFVSKRTRYQPNPEWPLAQIQPPLFVSDESDPLAAYGRDTWRGMNCPNCGDCTSRIEWGRWQCPCSFTYSVKMEPILPPPATPLSSSDLWHDVNKVVMRDCQLNNWHVTEYAPYRTNYIYHFKTSEYLNKLPGGADDLFGRMQTATELDLRRRLVGHLKADSEFLPYNLLRCSCL